MAFWAVELIYLRRWARWLLIERLATERKLGLFKYPHDIPLAQLAETLIQQRQVGSVVTQSADTDDEDDEEEELAAGMNPDFSANNDVFGLLTLFNISDHTPLARAVVKYLDSIALKESDKIFLKSLTQGGGPGAQSAGLIISERIVNLPSQISVPLFETLFSEIQKAKARGLPFNFQHYVLITQVLKEDGPGPAQGDHFVKVEEEIIQEHAERVIETMPAGYGGTKPASLRGNDVYEPNWRILVLAENKSQVVMEAIKTAFPI
ncbi:protein BCCIP homolog isoform X2 [Tigriopus californicus]|uniref:protein BCCIP homolog isoform X2 n=1 Tax=Tigriopus californicus TaxID=6832 RepID=UPI0027DA9989|nr:protein BCCIP homolog isoform X2 [Tigriopus californicus]